MRFRALSIAALGLALTVPALGAVGVAAQDGPAAAGNNRVDIELKCDTTPEITKVTNRGSKDLKIRQLTSKVDPISREPFKVKETLKRGQTITFETGKDARGKDKLSSKEIYEDDNNREGVVIRTSAGTFDQDCDD